MMGKLKTSKDYMLVIYEYHSAKNIKNNFVRNEWSAKCLYAVKLHKNNIEIRLEDYAAGALTKKSRVDSILNFEISKMCK